MKSTVLEQMNAVFVAAVDSMCEYILKVFSDIETSQGLEKAEEFLQEELSHDNMFNLEVVQPIFCLDPFLEGCHQYVSLFSERDVKMKAEYECIVEAITKAKRKRAFLTMQDELICLLNIVQEENDSKDGLAMIVKQFANNLIDYWRGEHPLSDTKFVGDIDEAIIDLIAWKKLATPVLEEYNHKAKEL